MRDCVYPRILHYNLHVLFLFKIFFFFQSSCLRILLFHLLWIENRYLKLPGEESFGVMSINSVNIGVAKSVRNDLYSHFAGFRHIDLKSKNINDKLQFYSFDTKIVNILTFTSSQLRNLW